jgi:hypothetical protein
VEPATGVDDTDWMRRAIMSTLAEWMARDPEAAEQWSQLRREDLPRIQASAS